MKNKSIFLRACDLPNENLNNVGLSFRDIAKRCHYLTINDNIFNDKDEMKLRRNLSNWVNDPKNLTNSKGKYIGDKFGARITVCRTDGLVLHDVETFCQDVRNNSNRILGINNNFIFFKSDSVKTNKQDKEYLFSTLNTSNLNAIENSDIHYSSVNVYKVKSSSVPSSDPNSILIKYSPNETGDNNVTIASGQIMDLHTTRKEVIQSACGKYGCASRISNTTLNLNHYVCKYVENKNDDGESFFCRLSYFYFRDKTILELAAEDGRFIVLSSYIITADLFETLSGIGPFTVFAPTDAAFSKLPSGTMEALLADVPKLTDILKYHVVAGKVMAADVVKLNFATTLAGLSVSVRVENGKVYINDSQVTITDIVGSNGVIHVIDTVLLPQTIVELLDKSKNFNKLVGEVKAAGLFETLSGTGPFTVFAPKDAAFSKLYDRLQQSDLIMDTDDSLQLLKYHVVDDEVTAADVVKLNFATTLADLSVSVRVVNEKVYINDSQVTITDIVGSNGVIHVIDEALVPLTIYGMISRMPCSKKFKAMLDKIVLSPFEEVPLEEAEVKGALEYTINKTGILLFNPSGDRTMAGKQSFTPDYDAYGDTVKDGRRNAFNLSRSMYDQSKAIELPGFKLLKDDVSLRFYKKDDKDVILVGIRGTDMNNWTELYTWAVIGMSYDLRMTTRFQEDLAKLISFQRNYPINQFYYVATGSSLAGSIADRFLDMELIQEAMTYNPCIEKKYILDGGILNHRVYLDTDPLLMLMGQYAPNTEIKVNPNKINYYNPSKEKAQLLESHTIYPKYNPAFEGGGMEEIEVAGWVAELEERLTPYRLIIETLDEPIDLVLYNGEHLTNDFETIDITMIIPSNDAFRPMYDEIQDRRILEFLVKSHTSATEQINIEKMREITLANDIEEIANDEEEGDIQALSGKKWIVAADTDDIDDIELRINGARFLHYDIFCTNGVIHISDDFLFELDEILDSEGYF